MGAVDEFRHGALVTRQNNEESDEESNDGNNKIGFKHLNNLVGLRRVDRQLWTYRTQSGPLRCLRGGRCNYQGFFQAKTPFVQGLSYNHALEVGGGNVLKVTQFGHAPAGNHGHPSGVM